MNMDLKQHKWLNYHKEKDITELNTEQAREHRNLSYDVNNSCGTVQKCRKEELTAVCRLF